MEGLEGLTFGICAAAVICILDRINPWRSPNRKPCSFWGAFFALLGLCLVIGYTITPAVFTIWVFGLHPLWLIPVYFIWGSITYAFYTSGEQKSGKMHTVLTKIGNGFVKIIVSLIGPLFKTFMALLFLVFAVMLTSDILHSIDFSPSKQEILFCFILVGFIIAAKIWSLNQKSSSDKTTTAPQTTDVQSTTANHAPLASDEPPSATEAPLASDETPSAVEVPLASDEPPSATEALATENTTPPPPPTKQPRAVRISRDHRRPRREKHTARRPQDEER